MSILDDILATKEQEVLRLRDSVSYEDFRVIIDAMPAPRSLAQALRNKKHVGLIAEIKKASPSKGIISTDFQPIRQAQAYQQGGADAISVLTDETYFQGSTAVLQQVAQVAEIPILRKDFIIDEWQVYESRAIGADAILLIASALPDDKLTTLYALSMQLGMDVLLEVHSIEELQRVLPISPCIIGINNRDLRTFQVDLQQTVAIAALVPPTTVLVSESGLTRNEDIVIVKQAGAHAVLVGESLMRSGIAGAALAIKELLYGSSL